jgi:hypothetical protein
MILHPAVIVHGLADVRAALAPGRPVTLLSAPGAGLYAGCLWWRSLVGEVGADSVLDCADGSGAALAALRVGANRLVLWREAPGWDAVAAIAAGQGGFVLPEAPAALDMAERGAGRRLEAWLAGN